MKNIYIETISKYPSAWTGHGLFAMALVEEFKPNTIVDLGVDYGFSSFCFAYPKIGMVYGIDWFQGDIHTGVRNTYESVIELHKNLIDDFGIVNLEFIQSDFIDASNKWYKPIDILHIDGLHTYDAVKSDYNHWIKFCNNDSIILFHDVESFPDTVGKFFNECDGYKIIKSGSAGLGILTKSKEKYDIIRRLLGIDDMKKTVFWHTYLVGDYKLIVQEQMLKFFTSGLYNEVERIVVGIYSDSQIDIDWFTKLLSTYNKFKPVILEKNEEEKPTLRLLLDYALTNESYILYIHTKAVSNTGYYKTLWRLSIDYNLIYRWEDCIDLINRGTDAVGINLLKDTHIGYFPHFSGNGWWTTSKYIRTLNTEYLYDKNILGENNRLTAEFFIGSNPTGNLKSIFECGDPAPYNVECLISDYLKIDN